MAHSAAMSALVEQLVGTLLPASTPLSTRRRSKDAFQRRLRNHNFGRTNQFEVTERLDGLEEKFQVLNYDELSDALHERRVELKTSELAWLPDVLDLLLHLSDDPVGRGHVEYLDRVQPRRASPTPLRWSEVEGDDPIDQKDQIWRIQDFSDLSSEDDEHGASSRATSPASIKQVKSAPLPKDQPDYFFSDANHRALVEQLEKAQFWKSPDSLVTITELEAVRESLFMLQGLEVSLFVLINEHLSPDRKYCLKDLSSELFFNALLSFVDIRTRLDTIRVWLKSCQKLQYMQTLRSSVEVVLGDFDAMISSLHSDVLKRKGPLIVSLAATLNTIEENSALLMKLSGLIQRMEETPDSHMLHLLFEHICMAQLSFSNKGIDDLRLIFAQVMMSYMKPIGLWLQNGELDPSLDQIFIERNDEATGMSRLWADWYLLDTQTPLRRPPQFLRPFVHQIFACGKTARFLRHLDGRRVYSAKESVMPTFPIKVESPVENDLLPFSETVSTYLQSITTSSLISSSTQLQQTLERSCGLTSTLHALSILYLARHGPTTESVDMKIFTLIDRCASTWNDRFLHLELLSDQLQHFGIEPDRLIVHSTHTSSRSLTSRRQSVKILGDLSIEYTLPWPLANIIPKPSMTSYRRISLFLTQIRRARYVLLRRAHFFIHNGLLHLDGHDRKFAQALHHKLLLFCDTLYDHLTSFIIEQATASLIANLKISTDIDSMITVFTTHSISLQDSCLTSKKLRTVHDAFLIILDLCIRFSDIVSMPTSIAALKSSDFEASSFISAQSRRRRRRDSTSDDDEKAESSEGEGYSSFFVLEDTTPLQEVHKIGTQFDKSTSFVIAALKGVAASGGVQAIGLELLADRLDWKRKP